MGIGEPGITSWVAMVAYQACDSDQRLHDKPCTKKHLPACCSKNYSGYGFHLRASIEGAGLNQLWASSCWESLVQELQLPYCTAVPGETNISKCFFMEFIYHSSFWWQAAGEQSYDIQKLTTRAIKPDIYNESQALVLRVINRECNYSPREGLWWMPHS